MNVWRSDVAKTAEALTSATPIINAAALDEVRRGLRPALSRASRPGVPNSLAIGHPSTRVAGLATVEETPATPRKSSSPPIPARTPMPMAPPGRTKRPTRKRAAPTTTVDVATTRRRLLSASKPSSGRIAATGGIFAARRAGTMTDAIVMPTPTTNAMMIVRGVITVPVSGNPAPAALKREISRRATPMPSPMPTIVAITDITSASTTIMRRTCLPSAPIARSKASSRSR